MNIPKNIWPNNCQPSVSCLFCRHRLNYFETSASHKRPTSKCTYKLLNVYARPNSTADIYSCCYIRKVSSDL